MAGPYKGYPSRRAYEDARARAMGYSSYREWQQLRHDPQYKRWLQAASRTTGESVSKLRRLDSELSRRMAAVIRSGALRPREERPSGWNRSGGPLARLLEYTGLREQDAPYRVGESPRGKGKAA